MPISTEMTFLLVALGFSLVISVGVWWVSER